MNDGRDARVDRAVTCYKVRMKMSKNASIYLYQCPSLTNLDIQQLASRVPFEAASTPRVGEKGLDGDICNVLMFEMN